MDDDFRKHDAGKLRWSLLPREVMRSVVAVLGHGATKYKDDNWKKCDDVTRYWDAFDRHRDAVQIDGELIDFDTGHSHITSMICNLIFIHWLTHFKPPKGDF